MLMDFGISVMRCKQCFSLTAREITPNVPMTNEGNQTNSSKKNWGSVNHFFADIFGKGNIDEHAVESWKKSCKTILKASALLFQTGDKELVPHIIALTSLIYGTVDCAEYIFNFGENFKQRHVASFLKTEAVKNFIAWFKDTWKR